MDTLTNYIVERIRIDNIKHPVFPVDGTIEDIIQFLKDNGFEDLKNIPTPITGSFNRLKIRGFHVAEFDFYLRIFFADTSKNQILRDNPVFIYDTNEKDTNHRFQTMDTKRIITDTVEKTMELLNKRFGL